MTNENIISRKGDVALIVCQNNKEHSLEIKYVTDDSGFLVENTDIDVEQIVGTDLREFLPQTLKVRIAEDLDFVDDRPDLFDILSTEREFGIVDGDGEVLNMNTRIYRDASPDNNTYFVILMQSHVHSNSPRALQILRDNAIRNAESGLLDEEWFKEVAELVAFYVERKEIVASMAVIKIDSYDSIDVSDGGDSRREILLSVASQCRGSLRSDDFHGYLGEGIIALMLVGSSGDNSVTPLNRMRWEFMNRKLTYPGTEDAITLSIAHKDFSTGGNDFDELISICLAKLDEEKESGNKILAA